MEKNIDTRVAVISIIIRDSEVVEDLNKVLHSYSNYIIGRMGLPYKEKSIYIISVAVDAPNDIINALSGKIGRLNGISSKVAYSNE